MGIKKFGKKCHVQRGDGEIVIAGCGASLVQHGQGKVENIRVRRNVGVGDAVAVGGEMHRRD